MLSIQLTLSLQNTSEQRELKDPAKDPQYSEPQIDAMRAQKDQVPYLKQSHACTIIAHHHSPLTLDRQCLCSELAVW